MRQQWIEARQLYRDVQEAYRKRKPKVLTPDERKKLEEQLLINTLRNGRL
jgi:hypothetical protein